jgi:uncharacterized protein with LGFP repeats
MCLTGSNDFRQEGGKIMPTNVGSLTVFGAIEQKWLALGGTSGFLGDPLTNETPTFDGTGRTQTFKRGIVSWHPSIGAHEVHGAIAGRWIEVGREHFGFPISDETTCPDAVGRFNHFRGVHLSGTPDSSIYWSPASGAHEVFGAIRDKWASMGFERGVLGYPVEPEHDQAGGGRTQRFQAGVITWTGSGGAAEHEVSGDTVTFNSGPVTSDLPLGANVQLVVQRNGTFTLSTHAHDSGFDNISYVISAILVTARGDAFTFEHVGHVEGTSAGLPFRTPQRNDDFLVTGQNAAITSKWEDIVASGRLMVRLTGSDKLVGAINELLAEAAAEAAKAGIKAVVALITA